MDRKAAGVWLCLVCAAFSSCAPDEREGAASSDRRPNILWVVWDTVRADRMGLYGHDRPTTPHVEAWARDARVFENALSAAGSTLPSHGSMFTGLSPSEHCTHNGSERLDDRYTTLAELLRDAGYRTYLFSANPHVSERTNLAQGFEQVEHPWQPSYYERALRLVQDKLPPQDRSSELPQRIAAAERSRKRVNAWSIKAAGSLAREALLQWLDGADAKRPYLAVLNYMEAHRPYIPPRSFRRRLMSADEVTRSYEIDRSWTSIWEYTFGLRDYGEQEIRLTRATYDAAILELDELFRDLLDALQAGGHLDDTVIVLTSDHGEQLGEHHMFDHQYSLYQPLLDVPLVVHYPPLFAPGRDDRPVTTVDLFPTLLGLAGVQQPQAPAPRAIDLAAPLRKRPRLAEDPASAELGLRMVEQAHPDWDPGPWRRQLRALVDDGLKYIWASDGRDELYDLERDPAESRNLADTEPEALGRMRRGLAGYDASLTPCDPRETDRTAEPTPEELELLRSLGYVN